LLLDKLFLPPKSKSPEILGAFAFGIGAGEGVARAFEAKGGEGILLFSLDDLFSVT
jgi:hypothetical protein